MITSFSQSHYSIGKAASWIGLGTDNVVKVETDSWGKMIPEALKEAVAAARARGCEPYFVMATSGTTVFGAFDPIDALADICKDENMWLHVDVSIYVITNASSSQRFGSSSSCQRNGTGVGAAEQCWLKDRNIETKYTRLARDLNSLLLYTNSCTHILTKSMANYYYLDSIYLFYLINSENVLCCWALHFDTKVVNPTSDIYLVHYDLCYLKAGQITSLEEGLCL